MARKITSDEQRNLYTGICAMAVRKINPNEKQYEEITGRASRFPLEYMENGEGKFPLKFLLEIKNSNTEGLGIGTFINVSLYVSKDREQNKDKTKTLFVNSKGQFAYLFNDGSAESNMDWYDKTNIRPAYVGEKDLSLIFQKLLAFTKDDDYTSIDEMIKTFYKKFDVSKLNAVLATTPNGMSISNGECGIVGMLSVSVNSDTGKKAQRMVLKEGYIMSTDVDKDMQISVSGWAIETIAKRYEKDRLAGYAPKDRTSLKFVEFTGDYEDAEIVDETADSPFVKQ